MKFCLAKMILISVVILSFFNMPTHAGIIDDVVNTVSKATKEAAAAATKAAKAAAKAADATVDQAVNGDYDAVADSVIAATSNPAPFRNTVLKTLVKVTPDEFKGISAQAAEIYKNLDNQYSEIKAKTYKSLYDTYRGDFNEISRRVQEGDFDVSEYLKYSLWYGIATADWSNPEAAVANIGKNQFAASSWYGKHTLKGAVISSTRDHIGLTNEAIEKGIKDLMNEMKPHKIGIPGLAILTEFMKSSRKNYIGPGETLEQGGCIISENGQYSVVFQNDANLVYHGKVLIGLLDHSRNGKFSDYLKNGNHCTCVQQHDGNLVVYGFQGDKPVGATLKRGLPTGDYFTVIQDDGNVVTYPGTGPGDVHGKAVWSSGTVVK
ncbi:MAG: hypothetical protein CVV64_15730 [Candidatus Wallbacteria bacterium HGW-Wallbacteria-1]|jgi:hypothetical protein|uniref:Bulb-type lectin domain-containing protein n=1 Tax=Candidatus Wallbacteria bacterium HGW-Wallbacteria-1 TaxID=2013854 RepID=A0A2N1PLE9_9BACT|nr:MAG: hypothetical protein CVV64_15730 [Candidatus Wallbacteria bacterium HGW-Wallbacteria-1]